MPQLIAFDFVGNRRPWAHDAHVAAQDVEELREFVNARPAQYPAEPRHAIIAAQLISRSIVVAEIRISKSLDVPALKLSMRCVIRSRAHRAKFVEEKNAAVHADAFLFVENGPRRIQFDQQSDQQPERRQQDQGGCRDQ